MGRNSGGVSGTSVSSSGGSVTKGATEKGYSAKMIKNILGMEQRYRNNRDETAHIFSDSGTLIKSIGGKGAQVVLGDNIPENSIITHNHPRSIGSKGILRIGNSFSDSDIKTAVNLNVKEMRAVTPTYTFSIKRPKKGWGVSSEKAMQVWSNANLTVGHRMETYLEKANWSKTALDRANATHFHQVMKIVSKQLGWDYSKKRG